ncbi:MAG: HPr family phosphocarrier protein, partial [Okeania sp. SIO3B3]|nr:HPr family phosphocarrier protein [Okeania sp. SIO3B3]
MPDTPDTEPAALDSAQEIQVIVKNPMGLHARPAANFVKGISRFLAEIQVGKVGDKLVNAKSINQVATLGVRCGEQIVVRAAGADAAEVLAAVQALADDNFGEAIDAVKSREPSVASKPLAEAQAGELIGVPASPGVAIGPVYHYRPQLPEIVRTSVTDVAVEWSGLQVALGAAYRELESLQTMATSKVGSTESAIFGVHQMFLQDPSLQDTAKALIYDEQINAAAAWHQAVETLADDFRKLDDDYLRGRVADVLDVGQR